ncbi:MAG: T9SS type A sorting domain-containing protein [Weeksellaceae bacterium]|nr:T9SS type A sorting domain-containing protein [Weeksellaceae bacterium]
MKTLHIILLFFGSTAFAQTITFAGCYNLFDNQMFTFNKTGVDGQGKNIYITTPVDGQPCSGLGSCEFKIQWNNALTRWEFIADEGNGTFASPYLIYYNSTGNSSALNPPGNTFGTWTENIATTTGLCGGVLTAANSTMTGDVHNSPLSTSETVQRGVYIFPNPVTSIINISGIENGKRIQIYNSAGQLVVSELFNEKVNVSQLAAGLYFLRITSRDLHNYEFRFIKK